MARPLRIEYDGALYHITSRGNNRKPIFRNDTDRVLFLDTLGRVTKRFHWICHGYCLMNNHYHLIIETPDGNLSKGMRQLNGVYTQAFNRRHRGRGPCVSGAIQSDSRSKGQPFSGALPLRGVKSGTSQSHWASDRSVRGQVFNLDYECVL